MLTHFDDKMLEAMRNELTPKQNRFVTEYLKDLNACQAAIRAGYSKKGARVRGAELLANRNVSKKLAAAQAGRSRRLQIEGDDVVRQLTRILFASITDYVSWSEGRLHLKPIAEIDDDAAIHSISCNQHGFTVRLHDKIKAAELLGRHLGMFLEPPNMQLNLVDGSSVVERLKAKIEEYAERSE